MPIMKIFVQSIISIVYFYNRTARIIKKDPICLNKRNLLHLFFFETIYGVQISKFQERMSDH
jgi:hypothetical protein